MKPKVLVFLGTSRQGAAVVDALLASDKFEVYATTRSAKSAEGREVLVRGGVVVLVLGDGVPVGCALHAIDARLLTRVAIGVGLVP